MSLLGDDGRGFELARRLELLGIWRTWLGDTLYPNFVHFLASPSSWDSFMRTDLSKSKAQIQLQLRARALLFDKASASLFHSSNFIPPFSSSSLAVSKLNPNYLQLHGDDVYFSFEDGDQRQNAVISKSLSKSSFSIGSRYKEPEMDSIAQRFRNDELPESWYNQFMEKYKVNRPYKLSFADRDSDRRSPEEMSTYLRLVDRHKRRRVSFVPSMHPSSVLDGSSSADDDIPFFPEMMFMSNCVPDSGLPRIIRVQENKKIEFHGVLDSLPQTRSSVVIERLGISVEQGGRTKHGSEGNRKLLGQEQALQISQKVVARMLARTGFDSATEVPVEVLSQALRCHISKLGRILKVLADSYRKQCSATDLLKMFLQTTGFNNLGSLMELVKDGTRSVQLTQQQMHGFQSQLQTQNQSTLRLPQQIPRQMHPQMQQQMVHPQNLTFQQQQQLERMHRRQQSTPRPAMDMDKDRPLVQVKLENPSELPMDGNAYNGIHSRHPQMQQFRQQQLAAMSNVQAQSSNQFRQLTSMQIPQMHSPNMGVVRAQPVKVEGFQELMGGDASLKHDSEENKLTSATGK
ncbi:uncharacterized protein LOC126655452 isoform X2 [Mercurialis annua]|uniref:uncharacterized protein LOC126655452 isoform X2 n=1 Tax=Mercurialis annua TaxID=3986 RepID=UPI0021606B58|nr:uncharacterized protein LOC126655452 isoform X2 [Mercurialis annua]